MEREHTLQVVAVLEKHIHPVLRHIKKVVKKLEEQNKSSTQENTGLKRRINDLKTKSSKDKATSRCSAWSLQSCSPRPRLTGEYLDMGFCQWFSATVVIGPQNFESRKNRENNTGLRF